jgi:chromosome segregation ATPase
MSLFSRGSSANLSSKSVANPTVKAGGLAETDRASGNANDLALFGSLGEDQQLVEVTLGSVQQGLVAIEGLVEQISQLRYDVGKIFEDHRKLALSNSTIRQERDQVSISLDERIEQHKFTCAELAYSRAECEEVTREYERTLTKLEALEHRHHLLSVAKRETQETLDRQAEQLATANEEVNNLRIAVSYLEEMRENHTSTIASWSAKHNDLSAKVLLLSNERDAFELDVQKKSELLIAEAEKYHQVSKEKDAAINYGNQKEREASDARAEYNKLVYRYENEKNSSEAKVRDLRAELDRIRPRLATLEEFNRGIVTENENLSAEVCRLTDLEKQTASKVERLEASVQRANVKLETALEAKAKLEESREAMGARLEATAKLLSEREFELKRVSEQADRLTAQIEEQHAKFEDTVQAMSSKILEVEKDLLAQRNETAFYVSQVETGQRNRDQNRLK